MILLTIEGESGLSFLEILLGVTSTIIAGCSLLFTIYIFRYQKNKDSTNTKLDWYKSIIIESKFNSFFDFFGNIKEILSEVKNNPNLTNDEKKIINNKVIDCFTEFRQEFISLLLAVDRMLYFCVKNQFDKLVDGITEKLFDDKLDFSTDDYQNELITYISTYKTNILKVFVEFKGENDSHSIKKIVVKYKEIFGNKD